MFPRHALIEKMMPKLTPPQQRRRLEGLDRPRLSRHQLDRLGALFEEIVPANAFYAEKLSGVRRPLTDLEELSDLPFTTKDELAAAAADGFWPGNLTYDLERYVRFHQTSGTRGRPMAILDTMDDWRWFTECWQYVLDAANLTTEDRVLLAFSFGPFIGFWSAHEALAARGAMVVPGGGMSTEARLSLLAETRATALFCTPSYALRMAEVAANEAIDIGRLAVRHVVVAGEPGGSVAATRARIETAWQAKLLDHAGASEVGPWGYGDQEGRGLHVIESEFIAEFLSLENDQPAKENELAELVITTLGRSGCPVIRYRTGDVVRPTWPTDGPNRFVLLAGGVLGRTDDMMIIRGVNIFPSSIEQILRGFPDVLEYRATASRRGDMDELAIEVEGRSDDTERIAAELQIRLGLRVPVKAVPPGSLPRFEGKGRRFVDRRGE